MKKQVKKHKNYLANSQKPISINDQDSLKKENDRMKWLIKTAIEELEAGNNGAACKLLKGG